MTNLKKRHQKRLKMRWTTAQIIDFEYLLQQDSSSDEDYLKKRDRDIYLNKIMPKGVTSKSQMLLFWLDAMKSDKNRQYEKSSKYGETSIFIGDMYDDAIYILKISFAILGILAGLSICLTLFSYTGEEPLNIAYFFALTLFPQLLFLFIFLLSFLSYKKLPQYHIIYLAFEPIFLFLQKRVFKKELAYKGEKIISAIKIIKHCKEVYGSLFIMPIFIAVQIFGITFNVGVVGATLFRVLFFDTAFGWQSTLQISPQLVAKMVNIIAAPWSWILPAGVGFPDIDQIVGSRIILKDGIYHLTTSDLVSWWPFLCLTILFYGLLPRLVIFIYGSILLKQELDKQQFDHAKCSNLIRRMVENPIKQEIIVKKELEPVKEIKSSEVEEQKEVEIDTEPLDSDNTIQDKTKISIALVPVEIRNFINMESFNNLMSQKFKLEIKEVIEFGIDFDSELKSIEAKYKSRFDESKSNANDSKDFAVVILQEAWQAPIREILNFIKSIRQVVDKKTPIVVALTGRAGKDNFLTLVEKSDLNIWKMKLSTINDPWLTIEKVVQ
ncbi:MAG: DUF2868 domain-containing protein [Desulfamplus sp.]|nr:DUF2868 domain-containing protein [Desulfamplus sp.]